MSLRLEQEKLQVGVLVGENAAQTVVEGMVTVPESEPAIGRALMVKANPRVTGIDVVDERVALEGVVDVELLYASFTETEVNVEEDEEEEVLPEVVLEERLEKSTFAGAFPFAFVLDVPGAEPDLDAEAKATVESVSFEVQGDERTVDVDVVLGLSAAVVNTQEVNCCVGVVTNGDADVQQTEVRVLSAPIAGSTEVEVEGLLSFGGKAVPEKVLELALAPTAISTESGADKVTVSGALDCDVLYTAPEAGAAQAAWSSALRFQAEVPVAGVTPKAEADVTVKAGAVEWRVVENDEERGLAVTAKLQVKVVAREPKRLNVVTGIAEEGPVIVATRKAFLTLQEAVGEGVLQTTAEAVLELPAGSTPIERVLQGEARAQVEDVHVLGDKVAVEGTAGVSLLYVGRSGEATTLSTVNWPASVPLDLEIPIAGAEPGLERRVEVSVESVNADLINREMVEVQVGVAVKVYLWRSAELEAVVEAAEVPPRPENPASYTFVILQKGDTLWQIAQRYHTDVEAILRTNNWLENEDTPLVPGSKICIPKGRDNVA